MYISLIESIREKRVNSVVLGKLLFENKQVIYVIEYPMEIALQ